MLDFQASRWLIGKEIPPQAGNDHPTAIPTGVFKTKDGHLNIAASGQHMFRRLCETLGTEPLLDDPRFRTAPDRSKNRKALAVELEKAFGTRTTQEWVELLNTKGVPSGPILDVKQVYENEQIRHLKMAVPVKHPALGELFVQAPPVTLSRTPGGVRMPAPDTGEHNDEILAELGYSPADITVPPQRQGHLTGDRRERERAEEDLGPRRGGRERVAVHPERLLGRGDGPPGLRLADHRHAAWRRRLPGGGEHAAGHLHPGRGAPGPRAVERSGPAHEDPRRGRLRRHLPDDQHRAGGGGDGARVQVPAARLPELGPGARLALRGRPTTATTPTSRPS